MGAIVSYNMEPDYGHYYPDHTIAGDVSNWCYRRRGGMGGISDHTINSYKYEKGMPGHIPEYYNMGYFRKFDQFKFAKSLGLDQDRLGVKQWGFYYIPNECVKKSCRVQLLLHGCGGMAEYWAEAFAPYAASNDIIQVYPQGINCWDNGHYSDSLTKNGTQMKFM